VQVISHCSFNSLIVKFPSDRFGCLARGDADVRDHIWFETILAEQLLRKEIPAVWVPEIKDALDASHFDSYEQLEQEEVPTKALSPAQQELFLDF